MNAPPSLIQSSKSGRFCQDQASSFHVPESRSAIATRACEQSPIATKAHAVDGAVVPFQQRLHSAGACIPQLYAAGKAEQAEKINLHGNESP
jgi:hypothetical protein